MTMTSGFRTVGSRAKESTGTEMKYECGAGVSRITLGFGCKRGKNACLLKKKNPERGIQSEEGESLLDIQLLPRGPELIK